MAHEAGAPRDGERREKMLNRHKLEIQLRCACCNSHAIATFEENTTGKKIRIFAMFLNILFQMYFL